MNPYTKIAKRYQKFSIYLYKLALVFLVLFIISFLLFQSNEQLYRICFVISLTAFAQGGMLKVLSYILQKRDNR